MSDMDLLKTIHRVSQHVVEAEMNVIRLSTDEQLRFWNALHAPVRLTEAQVMLGRLMRGEE